MQSNEMSPKQSFDRRRRIEPVAKESDDRRTTETKCAVCDGRGQYPFNDGGGITTVPCIRCEGTNVSKNDTVT
jgi:DnaJ-class molecular chaperone